MAPLQRLATLGLSMLLPHHLSKGKTIAGQAARGSGALPSFVDIIIEMGYHSHPDDLDRRRRLTAFSRYSDTPRHLLMELSADGRDYVVLHSGVEAAFGESWQAVLHILSTATFRMTRQEILEQWPEEYAKPDATTLWRWLSRAVTEGVVRQTGTGRQHDSFRYWLPTRQSMMRPDGGSDEELQAWNDRCLQEHFGDWQLPEPAEAAPPSAEEELPTAVAGEEAESPREPEPAPPEESAPAAVAQPNTLDATVRLPFPFCMMKPEEVPESVCQQACAAEEKSRGQSGGAKK